MLAAALLLPLVLPAQVATEIETGVRSDVRAGVSPSLAVGGVSATGELAVTPLLRARATGFGLEVEGAYSPTLQLRAQLPAQAGVLGTHTAMVRAGGGQERRGGRLLVEAGMSAGRQDLGTAARLLGQPAGAGVGGAFSLADARTRATFTLEPLRHARVWTTAMLGMVAVPLSGAGGAGQGIDVTAFFLLPDVTTLEPQFLTEIETGGEILATRRLRVGAVARFETVSRTDPIRYRGLHASAYARYQVFRRLFVRGAVGGLGGVEANFVASPHDVRTVSSPYADLQIDGSLPMMRGATLDGSAGMSVIPAYDLFAARVINRFTTRAATTLILGDFGIRGAFSTWSVMPELGLNYPRPMSTAIDAHVGTLEAVLRYAIYDGVEVGAGGYGFLRIGPPPPQSTLPASLLPGSVLPEAIAFVYLQASTTFHP